MTPSPRLSHAGPSAGSPARHPLEAAWSAAAARPWLDLALAPLALAFRVLSAVYHRTYDLQLPRVHAAGVPVVSVGNLVVGGTGKTPVASWMVGELQRRGARPALLHGGYAEDEPALHREWRPEVPVLAQRDRVDAARRAVAAGASVLVLDDGFQHRRLARDLDVVLVAAETWSEKRHALPRGPWREPPCALRRADVVVVTRKTASLEAAGAVLAEAGRLAPGATLAVIALRPAGWRLGGGEAAGSAPAGPVLAVAAVAYPEAFVENARGAGADVAGVASFRDHHHYGAEDAARIVRRAGALPIVTTAKDWLKLRPLLEGREVWVLEQDVVVEIGARELDRMLDHVVPGP